MLAVRRLVVAMQLEAGTLPQIDVSFASDKGYASCNSRPEPWSVTLRLKCRASGVGLQRPGSTAGTSTCTRTMPYCASGCTTGSGEWGGGGSGGGWEGGREEEEEEGEEERGMLDFSVFSTFFEINSKVDFNF